MEFICMQSKIRKAKQQCLDLCMNAGKGHVTSAFSCAEIVCVLYWEIMRIKPEYPDWTERDRFVMSKNHGMVMVYPVLEELGYFGKELLNKFSQNGSLLSPHSRLGIPGVDFAGGSLGIGLGVACGLAYAALYGKKDWLTFCVVGDGELYEGSMWEALMFAGHNRLSNLVVFIDRNKLCMTNFTESTIELEPLSEKITSFGWEVREIDGHSIPDIRNALLDVRKRIGKKPLCIIANTVKGKGIDFMEGNPFMHGIAPFGEKAEDARKQVEHYGK